MRTAMKKNSLVGFLCLVLSLFPCVSGAALVIKTELVSGRIVQVYADGSVKLDNGSIYRPSRKGMNIDIKQGEAVTLRYMVEPSGEKKFFEYAPGIGGLAPIPPPSPKAGDKRNK